MGGDEERGRKRHDGGVRWFDRGEGDCEQLREESGMKDLPNEQKMPRSWLFSVYASVFYGKRRVRRKG